MKTATLSSSARRLAWVCLLLLLASTPGIAAAQDAGQKPLSLPEATLDDIEDEYLDVAGSLVPDPLEPWNRAMYTFNDALMEHAARPAYKAYAYVTPKFIRTGIKNFFHNLSFPIRFVNNILQGRGKAAGVEMSRFILNTTAGIGGLFNVARHHEPVVPVEDEDFGQTLGVWGFNEGCYIIWPVLGPSTVRDSAGMVGNYLLTPTSYLRPWEVIVAIRAGQIFNELDGMLDLYDTLKGSAVEPYSAMRDAYVQYRRAKLLK